MFSALLHLLSVSLLLVSVSAFSAAFPRLSLRATSLKMAASTPSSFYEIVEKDNNGNDVSFEKFRGKVVYGVNVASRCGYTASGYALLSRIAEMKDLGVEVAIFPCNQV
jgi:glutathione peroxidase